MNTCEKPTRALAEFIAGLRYEDIPPEVIDYAKDLMADALSGALAGMVFAKKECGWIKGVVDEFGGNPMSTVWQTGEKTSTFCAALANATMGHTVDFDDTYFRCIMHCCAALTATVISVGEAINADGRQMLTAFVAGFEGVARAGNSVNAITRTHYKYFHTTATADTFACTMALCNLYGFDADQTERAIGLAADQAQGFRLSISQGDFTKSLHAGFPASRAVMATALVRQGCTAYYGIFEDPQGWCAAMSEDGRIEEITQGLGEKWEIMDTCVKFYPSLACSHTAVENCMELVKEHQIDLTKIKSIVNKIHYLAPGQGDVWVFNTPLHARLSMPYSCCAAMVYGNLRLEYYDDQYIDFATGRPRNQLLCDLMDKTTYPQDPELNKKYPTVTPCFTTITMEDGTVYERFTAYPKDATPERRATKEQLEEKFMYAAGSKWTPEQCKRALTLFRDLEHSTAREVVDLIVANQSANAG